MVWGQAEARLGEDGFVVIGVDGDSSNPDRVHMGSLCALCGSKTFNGEEEFVDFLITFSAWRRMDMSSVKV